MKAVIIYHVADLDGHMSGHICYKYVTQNLDFKPEDIIMIPADYGDDWPDLISKIPEKSLVMMADISFDEDCMRNIRTISEAFVWIDHHATAISKLKHLDLYGIQRSGTAACELCWEYCFPDSQAPACVSLLGQYDVWNKEGIHSWELEVMPYQYFMKMRKETIPPSDFLEKEINEREDLYSKITIGREIYDFVKRQSAILAETYAHQELIRVDDKEFRLLCINSNIGNSMAVDSLFDPTVHSGMCVYRWKKPKWILSFYHSDAEKYGVNLGKLAERFGGGGHAGAAGCALDKLPWEA